MNRNYKNIIPNLVSFDTTLKSIVGFRLSDNFDFYNSITNKKEIVCLLLKVLMETT